MPHDDNSLFPVTGECNELVFVSTDTPSQAYRGSFITYDSNTILDPRDAAHSYEPKRNLMPTGNLNQNGRPLQRGHRMSSIHESNSSRLRKTRTLGTKAHTVYPNNERCKNLNEAEATMTNHVALTLIDLTNRLALKDVYRQP